MLRIIVVDDTKEDLLLIQRILQQCKLLNPVSLVTGAAKCIEELERMQQGPAPAEPSLVLLDLVMPHETGLNVLRYLEKAENHRQCLVVMLSGLRDVKVIHEGYQLGAKTFLLKPLTPMDVVELVNSLSEISVEETNEGYTLHWKERLTHDSELRRMATRIKTFAA